MALIQCLVVTFMIINNVYVFKHSAHCGCFHFGVGYVLYRSIRQVEVSLALCVVYFACLSIQTGGLCTM